MSWVKSAGKGLTLRYTPKNVIPPVAARYMSAPFHPIRPKITHMYQTRDKNTLWWRTSVTSLHSEKKVVRSWCARRARSAFRHALAKQGFDEFGRPLPDSNQQEIFKGSMEVIVRMPLRDMPLANLLEEAEALLENIMELRERAKAPAQAPARPPSRNSSKASNNLSNRSRKPL
ncbi:hypothetical protein N7470_007870 [Penicillium chermesinum]|nr:hypothetical protein N7470_007870 [Penicillium chermesinum]